METEYEVPVATFDANGVLVEELLRVGEDELDPTVLLKMSEPLVKLVAVAVRE
jgi:hypothetical protein